MEVATENMEKVIDKLILAQNIYHQAVQKIQDKKMNGLLQNLRVRKTKFLADLVRVADFDIDSHTISTASMITLELEKIGVEVDNMIMYNTFGSTISFCLNRENELLNAYQDVLKNNELDEPLSKFLEHQKVDTEALIIRLESRQNQGEFEI